MDWLMTLLLGNAVVAGVLALVALLAMWVRKPAVAHVIWLLVLVKLLTPPVVRVEGKWGMGRTPPVHAETPIVVAEPREATVVTPTPVPSESVASASVFVASSSTPAREGSISVATAHARWRPSLAWWVGAVWIAGSIVYLVAVGVRVRRFCDLLKQAAPADDAIAEIIGNLSGAMGLKRVPEVRVVEGVASPMVFALRRAVMVLPASVMERLSSQQQRAIIAHELAHVRRGDHWVRWIELIATTLLWWHPLLWAARRGLHEAEEQCCDAWVVATMPADQHRRAYADALVDVLEIACGTPLPAVASGLGRISHLKRRLTMILDRTPAKSISFIGKIVVVLLAALLPLAPVRGDEPPAQATSRPAVDDSTRKAVESLLEMAQDENEAVRSAGMNAITRFGPKAVPILIEALGREKLAPLAQTLLPQMGLEAIEGLIEAIDSPEPAVRERSMSTLERVLVPGGTVPGGFEGGGMGGMPAGEMGMGMAPGRAPSGAFIGFVGSPYAASIATWVTAPATKASTDANPAVRRAAVRLLGAASSISFDSTAAQALAAAMKDEDASVRRMAAGAMVNVARFAPELSAALAAGVGDTDLSVRVSALNALGSLGPGAKDAMAVVTAALKDGNPQVRIAAANALGEMQSPQLAAQQVQPMGVTMGRMMVNANGSLFGGATPGDAEIQVLAHNVWHSTKLGRYDQAKRDADKILQLKDNNTSGLAILQAFTQVANERHVDLAEWLKRMDHVEGMKELVAEINKTPKPSTRPVPSAAGEMAY